MLKGEKQSEQPVQDADVLLELAAIAYRDKMNRELDEIANDADAPSVSPEAAQRIHNNVMNGFAQFRKKKARKRRRRRILRIAACLLLLCIILPIGIYQVDAARIAAANYIIRTFPQYSEIRYDVQNNALPPIGWNLPYYPAWLPEGTRVTRLQTNEYENYIWYKDKDGYEFEFDVLANVLLTTLFDSENMYQRDITINGYDAILSYDDIRCIQALVIPLPDCVLMIRGQISETEIIKMGEHINIL